jgi:hypothetical protein
VPTTTSVAVNWAGLAAAAVLDGEPPPPPPHPARLRTATKAATDMAAQEDFSFIGSLIMN